MEISYKSLKDNTLHNSYKISIKYELVNTTYTKARYFSKFHCKSRFWQIRLHEIYVPRTTFNYSKGNFEWLIMLIGLKNAPRAFQVRMDKILQHFSIFCIVYTNDILLFYQNRFMHITYIKF